MDRDEILELARWVIEQRDGEGPVRDLAWSIIHERLKAAVRA